jgi:1,4-dihydroxy-2-naphthoate octaprenyltransferase
MANNIRDLDDDKRHGRKTLAILCGKEKAIQLLGGMFAGSIVWVAALSLTGHISLWALLILLSIPKMAQAIIGFRAGTTAATMMPAMVATAQANTLFGLLLAIGLWLGKS